MSVLKRILIVIFTAALVFGTLATVKGASGGSDRQLDLIVQAEGYMADKVYVYAEPLLEEAISKGGDNTARAQEDLKTIYLDCIEKSGYRSEYEQLLESQMKEEDCPESVFLEAADYYLSRKDYSTALTVMKEGIKRTGSASLQDGYEQTRYLYEMNPDSYDYASPSMNGYVVVRKNGLFGLADNQGTQVLSCCYERISTFYEDRVLVQKGGETYAVDLSGNRLALLHMEAEDMGGYSEGLGWVLSDGSWMRVNSTLGIDTTHRFEACGTYSNGCAAAEQDGKWGIIDANADWVVEPQYDAIVMDDLGRAVFQNCFFAVKNGKTILISSGRETGCTFEDAKPFYDGYAAVEQDGKWGYIDTEGNVIIDYAFQDAKSFRGALAPVCLDGYWGYAGTDGQLKIAPAFLDANGFCGSYASVKTTDGWKFINLYE